MLGTLLPRLHLSLNRLNGSGFCGTSRSAAAVDVTFGCVAHCHAAGEVSGSRSTIRCVA